jgi:DnaJ-class molecular chaperone
MQGETCGICGGDGRIGNAFGGSTTTCPGCHGTGRKAEHESLLRDVTKTKPSHFRTNVAPTVEKKKDWPDTFEAGKLATEVRDSNAVSAETKERLIREIIDYEASHGSCTQTFTKKVRKQLKPAGK